MRVILSRTEKTNLYLSFKVAASQEVSSTFEIFENSQYFFITFFFSTSNKKWTAHVFHFLWGPSTGLSVLHLHIYLKISVLVSKVKPKKKMETWCFIW